MTGADERSPLGPPAIWAPWRLTYLEATTDGASPGTGGTPASAQTPSLSDPHATPGHPAPAPPARSAHPHAAQGSPPPASFLEGYWRTPENDHANHVLHRDAHGMILLNAYPYSNGHLLVALGTPRPGLLDYDPDQRAALWRLVDLAMLMMQRALEPQGVNVGLNQGRAAGAGVPQHLHVHLVPRWTGDVNFITAVGQIRVVPSALEQMASRYRAALAAIAPPA